MVIHVLVHVCVGLTVTKIFKSLNSVLTLNPVEKCMNLRSILRLEETS